jgi:transcriptional regulator with XRE-family HTH domain
MWECVKMAYTKFGEFMRVQRIKHHEVMGDFAKLLDVKISFVSAVENGKRNVPEEWYAIIVEHYNLSESEQIELRQAIEDSKTQAKIDLISASQCQRQVALQFQRSFDKLDDKTANEILKLLHKEDD